MFSIYNQKISDHAFFINLPKSTDRLSNIEQQINQFDIKGLYRLEALTDELHQSSATKSHFNAFSIADKEGYDTLCVFEDDFQFYQDIFIFNESFKTLLSDYLPRIMSEINNRDWDVILFGFNGKKPCIPISEHLSKNFKSTGAWAYLINRKTYQYILNNFSYYRDRLAIDDIIPYLTYFGFKSYVTNVQIAHHGKGFVSTLQPSLGPTDYTQWILGNYHRTIWHYLNGSHCIDFDSALNQLYTNSEFTRNHIGILKNFNGDVQHLINFMNQNLNYANIYTEIFNNYESPALGYYLSVECSSLVHRPHDRTNIEGLGSNLIDIEL